MAKFELTGTYNYFNYTFSHDYSLAGKFRIKVNLIAPVYTNLFVQFGADSIVYLSPHCIESVGEVFLDSISNCLFDTTESGIQNVTIAFHDSLQNIIGAGFSRKDGSYTANIQQGVVNARTSIGNPSVNLVCSANDHTFNTVNDNVLDFGVGCSSNYDLTARHSITGARAPGDTGFVGFWTAASGCDSGTAYIQLIIDSQLIIGSQIYGPAPDSIVGQSIDWTKPTPQLVANKASEFYKLDLKP